MTRLRETQRAKTPDVLSASFLLELVRGSCKTHKGPWRSSAEIQLLHGSSSRDGGRIGSFLMECLGMLNTVESATLRLAQHTITFTRRGYRGEWKMDDRPVAETVIGLGRRWLYWGRSTTRIREGTVLEVRMPVFGPSTRQVFNCVCTASVSNGSLIHMFLAKRDGEKQFLFDLSEITLLEQLSEHSRAVLLGELLRVRGISS